MSEGIRYQIEEIDSEEIQTNQTANNSIPTTQYLLFIFSPFYDPHSLIFYANAFSAIAITLDCGELFGYLSNSLKETQANSS